MTDDVRVGEWSLRATAGTAVDFEATFESGYDITGGVSAWIGGAVSPDPTVLTDADEFVASVVAQVASFTLDIPDDVSGSTPLRMTVDGVLLTVGRLHVARTGTPSPDGTITVLTEPVSIAFTVLGVGPIGGGASGAIRVEDEGSSVVAAATGINFAGAGVTVTNAGSNEALVTIPAGGGAGLVDGDYGDITVSGVGTVMNIDALAVGTAELAAGAVTAAKVAADVATQAELDAEAALARNADNLTGGTVADVRVAATIARDTEVTAAVSAEATLARNADNLTSGTVADARVASTIARDSEVAAAYQPLDADLTDIAAIADAQGDIIVRGAAGWERLAKSATSTDILQAGATQPAWGPASAPGAHASTHADGGADEVSLDGSQITAGTVADARIASTITRDSEAAAAYAPIAEPVAAAHIIDGTDAHAAAAVTNTPAGTIAATNVQAALDELDTEKATTGSVSTVATDLSNHLADGSDAHDASAISILDTAGDFTATEVEGALAELQTDHEADATALSDHIADSSAAHAASAVSVNSATLVGTGTDAQAVFEELDNAIVADETALANHLADTSDAHDASAISILDTAGDFTATNVEDALAELRTFDEALDQIVAGTRWAPDAITVPGSIIGDVTLSAGIAGGDTLTGGTAASETLTLGSTSHATRGTINLRDPVLLISEDKTNTTAVAYNIINTAATRTITFDSATAGANLLRVVQFAPVVVFNVNSGTLSGQLFNNFATIKNTTTVARTINPFVTLNSTPTFQADGATVTGGGGIAVNDAPTFNVINAGVMSASLHIGFKSLPTVNTGATVALRQAIWIRDVTGTGVVTTNVGIDIDAMTFGGTDIGIRNASSLLQSGVSVFTGGMTITDVDIALSTTTGTKFGTATTQKIGWWNATPVVQPAAYTQTYATADRTHAARTAATLTDNTAGTATTTLEALVSGTVYATDVAAIRNNFADLAAMVNKVIVDQQDTAQVVNSMIDDNQATGQCA